MLSSFSFCASVTSDFMALSKLYKLNYLCQGENVFTLVGRSVCLLIWLLTTKKWVNFYEIFRPWPWDRNIDYILGDQHCDISRNVITSVYEVMEVPWYPVSVCLSVCLSVSKLAGYLKKLLTDLNQISWNGDLRPNRLDFGTDPDLDLDAGWIFHLSNMEIEIGRF